MRIEYDRLTKRRTPPPKKYNSKQNEEALVNMLSVDALPHLEAAAESREVSLHEGLDKMVRIGGHLSPQETSQLLTLLRAWSHVLAWDVSDLVGISPTIIQHQLNASMDVRPVRQARCHKSQEQWDAVAEEVDKLLSSRCIE